jgi:RNA polymerase-associated protein LEO1
LTIFQQLHVLRIPNFLGLAPKAYDSTNFTLPIADHHSTTPSANFSANTTATSTIRYRKNPETGRLESNTIVSRWSDGSVTIAVGDQSYELLAKPLAPPSDSKTYQDVLDSHQYLATPYMESQLLHVVGHMTNQYVVKPNQEIQDYALEKLASGLAAATKARTKGDNKSELALISTTQDPELQKKQAEMAEKERLKAQRRREAAAARADQQTGRVRSGIGGGLTLDDLEKGGSRSMGSRKKRAAPSGPKRARRRADYDSDDDMPHGRSREDEYDLEDDFLAPSDEEDMEGEEGGDDESEEEVDDGSEDEKEPEPKKRKTEAAPRGPDVDAEGDSDIDAEGEPDDLGVPAESATTGDGAAGRGRKRNVIEDDDDE